MANEGMPNIELEELGRTIVEQVRDAAIKSCDKKLQLSANPKTEIEKRWRKVVIDSEDEKIVKTVIPDIVDSTIAKLLYAIDQELLKLSFTASNGRTVVLDKEGLGELTGWYMGEWRFTYTKERYVDDFSDLRDSFK